VAIEITAAIFGRRTADAASCGLKAHEHGWKDKLDPTWGMRPRKIVLDRPRTMLVLEDLNGFER
jgi:hypothetical protein